MLRYLTSFLLLLNDVNSEFNENLPAAFCNNFKLTCEAEGPSFDCSFSIGGVGEFVDSCCRLHKKHCKETTVVKKNPLKVYSKDKLYKPDVTKQKVPKPSTTQSPAPSSKCGNIAALRRHSVALTNAFRHRHHVPALRHDTALDESAQTYAEYQLTFYATCGAACVGHSYQDCGENIYMATGFGTTVNGSQAVEAWYKEVNHYDWNNPGRAVDGTQIGHFTQLVWQRSESVGHGFAFSHDCTKVLVVAHYDPPGNWVSQYDENVFSV